MSRKKAKKRTHRSGGRSVSSSVYEGLVHRLERMTADYNASQERVVTLESLLITVVAQSGGVIKVNEVRPGNYRLEAEHVEGGVMLILTDSQAPKGQGGKNANENRMGSGDVEPDDGMHTDQLGV